MRFKALISILVITFALPAEGNWSAIFLTFVQSPQYVGTETDVQYLPLVAYEGERFVWMGPFVSYRVNREESNINWFLIGELTPHRLDADDSDRLNGIDDRDFFFSRWI